MEGDEIKHAYQKKWSNGHTFRATKGPIWKYNVTYTDGTMTWDTTNCFIMTKDKTQGNDWCLMAMWAIKAFVGGDNDVLLSNWSS